MQVLRPKDEKKARTMQEAELGFKFLGEEMEPGNPVSYVASTRLNGCFSDEFVLVAALVMTAKRGLSKRALKSILFSECRNFYVGCCIDNSF